jgi:hypothetical protein
MQASREVRLTTAEHNGHHVHPEFVNQAETNQARGEGGTIHSNLTILMRKSDLLPDFSFGRTHLESSIYVANGLREFGSHATSRNQCFIALNLLD